MESPSRPVPPAPGVSVDPVTQEVTFRVDLDARCTPRRVWFHLRDFGADPTFRLDGDQWVARIPRPPVDRLEYLHILEWADGSESMVTDPANPARVRTVFGDKSVVEFPGYARPWWLSVADAADAQARRDAEAQAAAARRSAMTGRPRTHPRRAAGAGSGTPGLVAVARPSTLDDEPGAPPRSLGEGVASVRVRAPYRGTDERIRRSPVARSHAAGALVLDPGTAEVLDPEADVAVVGSSTSRLTRLPMSRSRCWSCTTDRSTPTSPSCCAT